MANEESAKLIVPRVGAFDYLTHDVMLFNSLREAGGAQLVESMASGLPIVTLNMHGPGEIVRWGRA